MSVTISPDTLTGLVLAGGCGTRVGGRDKGLIHWEGRALASSVCRRLRPQVGALWLSCNRNSEQYAPLADRIVQDDIPGFAGPLAGIAAADQVGSDVLIVVACDMPHLPDDLAARLCAPLYRQATLQATWAWDGKRDQYLAAAYRTSSLGGLRQYMADGGRAVGGWLRSLQSQSVDFSDQPDGFRNVNRLSDLS